LSCGEIIIVAGCVNDIKRKADAIISLILELVRGYVFSLLGQLKIASIDGSCWREDGFLEERPKKGRLAQSSLA
jgi:hypothetical protein